MTVDVGELLQHLVALAVLLAAASIAIGFVVWWFVVMSAEAPHDRRRMSSIMRLLVFALNPIVGHVAWRFVARSAWAIMGTRDGARQRESLRGGRTWQPRSHTPANDAHEQVTALAQPATSGWNLRDGQVYDPDMPRRTITVSITVDVDDPTALRAAAIADDATSDPLVPTLDETLGDAVVDAIADLAVPSLHEQGIHALVVDQGDAPSPEAA